MPSEPLGREIPPRGRRTERRLGSPVGRCRHRASTCARRQTRGMTAWSLQTESGMNIPVRYRPIGFKIRASAKANLKDQRHLSRAVEVLSDQSAHSKMLKICTLQHRSFQVFLHVLVLLILMLEILSSFVDMVILSIVEEMVVITKY